MSLSDFCTRIREVPPHLCVPGTEYWLVEAELPPADILEKALAVFQEDGWTPDYAERFDCYLSRTVEGRDERLRLHVDTSPDGWCKLGESYEGPMWPDHFHGRLILEVSY